MQHIKSITFLLPMSCYESVALPTVTRLTIGLREILLFVCQVAISLIKVEVGAAFNNFSALIYNAKVLKIEDLVI